MSDDTTRLAKQARERSRSYLMHKDAQLLVALADAVEQLQRDREELKQLGWERTVEADEARARVADLEDFARRAVDVIGGVWNGSVETLDEARGEARAVYHDGRALLDSGEDRP